MEGTELKETEFKTTERGLMVMKYKDIENFVKKMIDEPEIPQSEREVIFSSKLDLLKSIREGVKTMFDKGHSPEFISKFLNQEFSNNSIEISFSEAEILHEQISIINEIIESKNKIIDSKNELLKEKEIDIESKNRALEEKEQIIEELNKKLDTVKQLREDAVYELSAKNDIINTLTEEKNKVIESKNRTIEENKTLLASKDEVIEEKNKAIDELSNKLNVLTEQLKEKEKTINASTSKLDDSTKTTEDRNLSIKNDINDKTPAVIIPEQKADAPNNNETPIETYGANETHETNDVVSNEQETQKLHTTEHEPKTEKRTYLQRMPKNPEEGDELRYAGAKFDPEKSRWYIPSDVNLDKFTSWESEEN
ncbi:hypothetical protein FACS1894187_02660 [Synergistales bacterium]|nr:hypothetical protein FACS1894187_02660 [Synergistales bacterium]